MTDIANNPDKSVNAGFLTHFYRQLVLNKLAELKNGALIIVEGQKVVELGYGEPCVLVEVRNPQFWSRLALGGQMGAAEAYIDGLWYCDDLIAAMRLLLANRESLENMAGGVARLRKPFGALRKWFRRNSRKGSARNITAHYDLGNAFYRLWLDGAMMYSGAVFEHPDMSLEEAQVAKLEAICQKLELSSEDHVLEIGSGWGGFALFAASNYGCKVTTVTISQAQFEFALQRIKDAGLDHLISIELKDYRDLTGQYDKLVSIEMIEAVGEAYLDGYIRQCGQLLKPNGIFVLQSIVIAERLYDNYRRGEDFIQKHVFPGGFLPTTTTVMKSMKKTTDLRLTRLDDYGLDYAKTLAHWQARFIAILAELPKLGFDDRFVRLWEFYLCYCQAGFLERTISVVHMKCVKPQWR